MKTILCVLCALVAAAALAQSEEEVLLAQRAPVAAVGGSCPPSSALREYFTLDENSTGAAAVNRVGSISTNILLDSSFVGSSPFWTHATNSVNDDGTFHATGDLHWLEAPDSPELRISGDTMIDLYVTFHTTNADYQCVFAKSANGSNPMDYTLYKHPDNTLVFTIGNTGYGSSSFAVSAAQTGNRIALNETNYVRCWYNAGDKKAYVSLNGDTATSGSALPDNANASACNFNLGRNPGNERLNAIVDELAFWNRHLTTEEAAQRLGKCRPNGL
jgi:hypothetical protein